ncbi:MAG: leucyl-tRNA--protein transferase [Rectinemataceae bacterium]
MRLSGGPAIALVPDSVDPLALVRAFERGYPHEFCACASFEPGLIAGLVREGFIPMAVDYEGIELLTPKLHTERSILDPAAVRITKSARRAASAYTLHFNSAFDEVLDRCLAAHGDGWLRPPLVAALRELARRGQGAGVRLASFELLRGGTLVAGELGALIGASWTSYSGFRSEGGSGTVQLVALASALAGAGVRLWDLGMPLGYKAALGALAVDRATFLAAFRAARDMADNVDFGFLPSGAGELLRKKVL